MVSLAKRLEGRPFHLIATHCQNVPKNEVVSYIQGKGLLSDTPNMTVTSFGGHPKVKGNGYVPYYMVFDHTGKLAYNHMCGAYHGGDGLRMIEWVDELLAEAPDLFLGTEPFQAVPKLAKQVAAKKNLSAAVKQIEARRKSETESPAREEILRLYEAVKRYRDGALKRADKLMATDPSQVLPLLQGIQSELKGTELGAEVNARVAQLKSSKELKQSIAVSKSLRKIKKSLARTRSCKTCKRQGMKFFQHSCTTCRLDNSGAVKKAKKKLRSLIDKNPGLPITASAKGYLQALG